MNGYIQGWNEDTALVTRQGRGPADVSFWAGDTEMLRISRDGFYVEGMPVNQSPDQARRVHAAFLKWLRCQGMAV